MNDIDRSTQGMKIRREVLGDWHVDRAQASISAFNEPFQEFLTRYAWGEIWARPDLPRRTRSLLTLAMMVALNREEEFRLHVGAALRNGVTEKELQETLLHAAIYCGLPAANNAFRWAGDVLAAYRNAPEEGTPRGV